MRRIVLAGGSTCLLPFFTCFEPEAIQVRQERFGGETSGQSSGKCCHTTPRPKNLALSLCLAILIVIASTTLCLGKTKPEGKIRVAFYSRNYAQSGGGFASGALINDPMIDLRPVPVIGKYALGHGISPDQIRRAARIYFPRTYEKMLENDVTIFQEAPISTEGYTNFEPRFLLWCKKYVLEGGKALDMYGGDASFGGGIEYAYPSWEETPVADILPVEIIPGGNRGLRARGGRWAEAGTPLMVEFPDDVIGLSRLPWETAPKPNFDEPLNAVLFRPGCRRVAEAVHGDDRYPLIAYWEIGKGSSLAYTVVFGSGGTGNILRWKWYPDFVTYLMYYSAGVPMPENVYLPHVIRERLQVYISQKQFAYNYIDFISKMGGNTVKLEREIATLETVRERSGSLYLEGKYEESRDVLESAVQGIGQILTKAQKLEKKVMFWIYMIEWFTVVGTMMIAGVLLNFLMIQRRLYRETPTTRGRMGRGRGHAE